MGNERISQTGEGQFQIHEIFAAPGCCENEAGKHLALLAGRCALPTDSLWPVESGHFTLRGISEQKGESCSHIGITYILLR